MLPFTPPTTEAAYRFSLLNLGEIRSNAEVCLQSLLRHLRPLDISLDKAIYPPVTPQNSVYSIIAPSYYYHKM